MAPKRLFSRYPATGVTMPDLLDPAQVAAYERDGVVFPLQAFDAAEAAGLRQAVLTDRADALRAPSQAGRRQPSTRVKSYLLFPWSAALVRHPAILDAVAQVIGPDILVFHSTIWFKPAGSTGIVPWHQDGAYFGLAPFEHVTAWVALTASTPSSGCVTVIPGSHRAGQRPHRDARDPRIMLSRGQTMADPIDEPAAIPIILQAGQFSLRHTMVLHASQPNLSAGDRIGIGYIPTRVRHVGETRLSATLVCGGDRFGHFDPEPPPDGDQAAAAAAHADSLARFWRASEAIPDMSLVH